MSHLTKSVHHCEDGGVAIGQREPSDKFQEDMGQGAKRNWERSEETLSGFVNVYVECTQDKQINALCPH